MDLEKLKIRFDSEEEWQAFHDDVTSLRKCGNCEALLKELKYCVSVLAYFHGENGVEGARKLIARVEKEA